MIAWKYIMIHGRQHLRPQKVTEDLESYLQKYLA